MFSLANVNLISTAEFRMKRRDGATGFEFVSDGEGGFRQRAALATNLVAKIHDSGGYSPRARHTQLMRSISVVATGLRLKLSAEKGQKLLKCRQRIAPAD